jgi:Fur family ferric uptake transcriptional regulator
VTAGADLEARAEELLDQVRARGGRVTSCRRALIATLLESGNHHLTAQDLTDSVQRAIPDVHLSTIYRSLDSLEEIGIVDHAHLGHGRAVYHLADEPHQHLVCERCERVFEVPDDVFAELAGTLRKVYGFALRAHHFAVVGRCAKCEESATGDGR